jgi:hypothetical protein
MGNTKSRPLMDLAEKITDREVFLHWEPNTEDHE